MILCSLLDRFNVTLHMNDLQNKYENLSMNCAQLVLVQFQSSTLLLKMYYLYLHSGTWSWKLWNVECELSPFWLYLLFVTCSIICCTHPPCLELCRFGGRGFDQGDNNGRFNSLPLRLLRTGQPECRHWINTVPDPGREGETKTGRGRENQNQSRV